MSKLTPNQESALETLRHVCRTHGADAVSANEWKKSAKPGVVISAKSLVQAGVVKLIKAKNRDGSKLSELYAPL